jgi:hypothetical protein
VVFMVEQEQVEITGAYGFDELGFSEPDEMDGSAEEEDGGVESEAEDDRGREGTYRTPCLYTIKTSDS